MDRNKEWFSVKENIPVTYVETNKAMFFIVYFISYITLSCRSYMLSFLNDVSRSWWGESISLLRHAL